MVLASSRDGDLVDFLRLLNRLITRAVSDLPVDLLASCILRFDPILVGKISGKVLQNPLHLISFVQQNFPPPALSRGSKSTTTRTKNALFLFSTDKTKEKSPFLR